MKAARNGVIAFNLIAALLSAMVGDPSWVASYCIALFFYFLV